MSPDSLILLAEDDENDAFLFRMALHKAGVLAPVALARDGEEAIDYLKGIGSYADRIQYPFPCLMITDLKMPRLSGFEVLAWIQSHLPPNRLPAIVLSGSAEELDRQRAVDLGAKAYWVKPTDLANLVRLAHELNETWFAPLSHVNSI
jgi:CheY-like chemotaxis protein